MHIIYYVLNIKSLQFNFIEWNTDIQKTWISFVKIEKISEVAKKAEEQLVEGLDSILA